MTSVADDDAKPRSAGFRFDFNIGCAIGVFLLGIWYFFRALTLDEENLLRKSNINRRWPGNGPPPGPFYLMPGGL